MDKKLIFFACSMAILFSPLSSMPHFEPASSDSESEIEPAEEIMDECEQDVAPQTQSFKRSREKDDGDDDIQPEVKRPRKNTTTKWHYRSFDDTLEHCIENACRVESLTKKVATDIQQLRKHMTAMKKEDREQIKPTERKVVEIEMYAKYVSEIINSTKQSITSTSQSTALVPYQEELR